MSSIFARPALPIAVLALSFVVLSGCSSQEKPAGDNASPPSGPSAAAAPTGGPLTPEPGGKVVVVQLTSDEKGNYFTPAEVHAKRGDVVRYTLKVGVHNVHFFPDSNVGRSGYPAAASDLLQLPGQTWDIAVNMAPGTYYFQCDPHAALGMRGHLLVE